MEQIAEELILLDLPSPLWSTHIHTEYEFIAIVHIKFTNKTVVVDKGILLVEEKNKLTFKIFLNGFISQIPNITFDVTISNLSALLNILHNRNVCSNSTDAERHPGCLKLVDGHLYDEIGIVKYCEVCRNKCDVPVTCDTFPTFPSESRYDFKANNFDHDLNISSKECESLKQTKNFINECEDDENKKNSTSVNQGLCNICGKTFSSKHRISEHMLTHTLEKKFQCPVCKKEFAKSFNLKMHEHIHSGERPYACNTCGKTYTTGSNLRSHMFSCHKEEKRHVCTICQMAFIYPRYLKLHMRKHTGEKPYVCTICGKKFAINIHLTVHMRSHTGEKPYCCTICGKCFTTTGGLGSHSKAHHQNE